MQRIKTWDFAAKFLVRKKLVQFQKYPLKSFGSWTKNELVTLGPTFIKLGQVASTRSDIFETEFINELETLQDQVPPMSPNDVLQVLGPDHVFEDFDMNPYKSASLGQVHLAKLKDGTQVIVKIQRPGIREILEEDLRNIEEVLNVLDIVGISTGSTRTVFSESIKYIFDEIDYIKESQNAIKFKKQHINEESWVKIPKVYSEYTTNTILTMEFVESTKIMATPKLKKVLLAKSLVKLFVDQVMVHRFFHADPHPGNIGITPDGKIVLYDFGLAVEVPSDLSQGLMTVLSCLIQRDTRKMVDVLVSLNIIVPTADRDDVVSFFDSIVDYLEGKGFTDVALAEVLAREKPFILPSSFVFLIRSFAMIDGQCKQLDSEFTFYKYLETVVPVPVEDAVDFVKIVEMPNRIRAINTSMMSLERSRGTMKRSIEKTSELLKVLGILNVLSLLLSLYQ